MSVKSSKMPDVNPKSSDMSGSSDRQPEPSTGDQYGLGELVECGTISSAQYEGNGRERKKNFNLLSLAGIGLVTGNVWPALGGSLLSSIANGGAPGVIYEFLAVSICYFTVAAVLAEFASALPSSSGVLLWASVTGGRRYGRVMGYFAGYWNCLAWVFAEASVSLISGKRLLFLRIPK